MNRKDRKVNRSTPLEKDVRHAFEVLATADPSVLDEALRSARPLLGSATDALRTALVYRAAVESFEHALAVLPIAVDPATARAAQATENIWRRVDAEFGLLSSAEVAALRGARNDNRAFASGLRQRGGLLGVQRKNAYVYPGFQFDLAVGTIRPWVAPLVELAAVQDRTPVDVVMWMMSPTTYFGDDRPVDHIDDAQLLVDVAERAWNVQW
jgi:hypothetical protein